MVFVHSNPAGKNSYSFLTTHPSEIAIIERDKPREDPLLKVNASLNQKPKSRKVPFLKLLTNKAVLALACHSFAGT